MDNKQLLIELIKACKKEGYNIVYVVDGKNGVAILLYNDPNSDPGCMIHITNEGWTYYLIIDGKFYKTKLMPLKIDDLKSFVAEVLS